MGNGDWATDHIPLTRQSSIYSLTFDEFQTAVRGSGKDLGSMNMDELLRNIWSAEENHSVGSTSGVGGGGAGLDGGGYLQRQGSLAIAPTLSQKTVDEVWNDISKEFGGGKDGRGGITGFNIPHKEKTLGEITLEEFLAKAGVVKEETLPTPKPDDTTCFSRDFPCDANSSCLGFSGYQQQQEGGAAASIGEISKQITNQPPNLPLNVNGSRSATQEMGNQKQSVQQAHPQILPKQSTLAFGAPMDIIPTSARLSNSGIKGSTIGVSEMNKTMAQNGSVQGGGVGMVGVCVGAATGSPAASSDGLTSNGDASSVSPVPFLFNGSLRGRRSAGLEKVVERRQRRMIKNRESAARSRARKQAYTMELEAEMAILKEENALLQKKLAEIKEMQKNLALETMKQQNGNKKRCLRRTQTSPW